MRWLALALLLGAAACSAAPRQDDAAVIRAALTTWMEDFNAGRADRLCDLFARDLRFDFRGQPERGYAEMCAQLQRAVAAKRFSYAVRINEVLVFGDTAIVRLRWRLTTDGEASDEPGLDVFSRQADGRWRIVRYLGFEDVR
jgi:uncharacterized protein (TIGR02246 family)